MTTATPFLHDPKPDQKTILFVHIPKAAGTTLNRIIDGQYRPAQVFTMPGYRHHQALEEFKALPPGERARYAFVKGHFPYGLHEIIPRPCTYLTVLRDPVDRVGSLYWFARHLHHHYLHKPIVSGPMSLEDFFASDLSPEIDNGMTKMISGEFTPCGGCTREHFEMAKRNLQGDFSVVALAERFDESLILMRRRFGWSYPFYVRENVTTQRPRHEKPSDRARTIFAERNAWDLALYDYAAALFEEAVRQEGPGFQQDLKRFRLINRPYMQIRQAVRSIKRILLPKREEKPQD